MSPVAGLVRNRKHQFGRQSALGTAVAAVRAYAFKGVPSINPNWTDPDVDVGSIDLYEAPYRTAGDYTAPLNDPVLKYNTLPLILAAFFGGGVMPTGAGTSKTWAYAPSSTDPDDVDVFAYEFGDDVADDWYQCRDGVLESFEISGPEGLGPLTVTMNWRFGAAFGSGFTDFPDSPAVPTTLTLDRNQAKVFLKDLGIYLASDPADLATAQITDALHSFVLRGNRVLDQKRYANGSQEFDITAYATASRVIELECSWAKTTDIVGGGSESDAWFSETSVDRFVRLYAVSKEIAETGTPDIPYSADIRMPMRYYTRAEGESGGNSTVVLTGRAFYDPDGSATDFGGVFTADVVNTLPSAGL